jgi:hypothetical protein
MMQAFLFASATAATLGLRRAAKRASHPRCTTMPLEAQQHRARPVYQQRAQIGVRIASPEILLMGIVASSKTNSSP